ncbi:cytochrome P450 [Mycolicibacterium austroafricanum]|uniref:cytochrome P450 n=1 Tax=Mycolicibacterium austroafricanum TaxID=39687 RepID=UPI0005646D98|nr:cytochrome P450 [Mycolicibacterium austroafricanum]QZY47055.1 cytochrome P450 [Mycolicibacterium austroafricanum]
MTAQPDTAADTGGCPVTHAVTPTGCPVSSMAAQFDPFTGAYQVNPADSLARARREEPVFYSPILDYWVVTRYEDVKAIFRDPDTFSAAITLEQITPISEEAIDILDKYDFAPGPTIVNEDEPMHTAHRRALMEPFEIDSVSVLAPRIHEVITEYVDRFIKRGQADLIDDLIYEVPCIVALMFLGVPDEDIETCRQFGMQQTLFTWGRPDESEQERVATGMGQFWEFAGSLVQRLKETPDAPGWIPHAIRAQAVNPELITDNYLQNIMMSGILAAHETTTNATANAFRTLLENREAWDELCNDLSLIPKVVEECLRYAGSVVAWRRMTTDDVTVGGVEIPAGSRLLIVTASANRDDTVFDEPDRFDIHRSNSRRHLTFGLGTHTCMGATLARTEMKIFLEILATRLPHMHLVDGQEYTYLPNTSFRGPEHVLVHWDPAANPIPADRP